MEIESKGDNWQKKSKDTKSISEKGENGMKYGFYATDVYAKITDTIRESGKVKRVPVIIGFKQYDETWVNKFFTIVVFEKNFEVIENMVKGDRLKVSGRVSVSNWTNKENETKEQWSIVADEISLVDTAF